MERKEESEYERRDVLHTCDFLVPMSRNDRSLPHYHKLVKNSQITCIMLKITLRTLGIHKNQGIRVNFEMKAGRIFLRSVAS